MLKEIKKYLVKNEFTFIRQKKHQIWEHNKTGRKLVVGTSPKTLDHQIRFVRTEVRRIQNYQTL